MICMSASPVSRRLSRSLTDFINMMNSLHWPSDPAGGGSPDTRRSNWFHRRVYFRACMGTIYSTIGLTIGSWVAFTLARFFGFPLVEKAVKPGVIDKYDHFLKHRGLIISFFVSYSRFSERLPMPHNGHEPHEDMTFPEHFCNGTFARDYIALRELHLRP